MIQVPTKRRTIDARLPVYGSSGAIGADLFSDLTYEYGNELTVSPGHRHMFKTGISMAIPEGWYGRIAPRSGLALKNGIDVLAGVIDSDFRGEICVILINHGYEDLIVKHGDRIAQIIFESASRLDIEPVDELDCTVRGSGGLGSTGI